MSIEKRMFLRTILPTSATLNILAFKIAF
ncbi:hypothetical protein LINGRAHAP2_LOCUS11673 [Linum grandiflorum]